jgi:1-aminocyclopropane-1-carboxylate deaminase/D-cysteine desulfhydrase-like pyridoxal-dependent ACC family enzyme
MMNKAPPCKTETLSQQDVTPDQLKALIDSLPGLKYLLAAIPWQEQRRIVSALRQTVLQCQHFNQHLSTLLPELSLPPRTWWIPEGGNNALGIWSIAAWAKNTLEHMDKFGFPSDTWIIPVGSSATFKGILAGFSSTTLETLPRLIGVPVFNNSHYLDREISDFIERSIKRKNHQKHAEWLLWHNQDVGGFGKVPNHLSAQEKSLTEQLGVPLDRVYTLKVAYALAQYLARTSQPSPLCQLQSSIKRALSGSLGKICLLHTGGLQGNRDLV